MLAALLQLRRMSWVFKPRFNIAPTQDVPVVRIGLDGEREIVSMHWGLIPSWAKDRTVGYKLINARSESADSKPAFRMAFRARRCVIPAAGFYEWKKMKPAPEGGGKVRKQPYFITLKANEPMVFAGLWESWTDRESGEHIDSCTILTTDANATLRELHDRMPVVLDEAAWTRWLDPRKEDVGELKALLRPAPDEWFTMRPVSPRVNVAKVDEPSLIAPVEPEQDARESKSRDPRTGSAAKSASRKRAQPVEKGLFD
jgi:putative SOS response-associated peptidase YedK